MALIVQKFGGTSVADIDRIKHVAGIIRSTIEEGNKVIAVVSAMAGVTNALITKCNSISPLNMPQQLAEYDAAVSSGEIITSALLALELQNLAINAKSFQGWQVPIHTTDNFTNALIDKIDTGIINQCIGDNIVPVITGFQGVNNNKITTLGKGGSDTTAALIASAFSADRLDIYTDVDGIHNADPRIVHTAAKLDYVDTKEVMELSGAGAKVLHPRAILAANRYDLDVRVLSSFTNNSGTIITSEKTMENRIITAITSDKNLLQIHIEYAEGNINNITKEFINSNLQINHINNNTKNNLTIIANLGDKNKFELILERLKNNSRIVNYTLTTNISTVTLVGYGIKSDSNLNWQIIDILARESIKILAIDNSELKTSIMVSDQDTEKVIKLLHDFYLDEKEQKT